MVSFGFSYVGGRGGGGGLGGILYERGQGLGDKW